MDLGVGDGRCYYSSLEDPAATDLSWSDASQACEDQGAELASIPDPITYYALSYQVNAAGKDAWTGLLSVPGAGHIWLDGSQFNPELDQFVSDKDSGTYGYLSSEDSQIHLDDGSDTKAFVCSTGTGAPTPGTTPEPTATPCPAGWEQSGQTCYLFSEEMAPSWTAAGHSCVQQGGALVSIHDQTLITFLLVTGGDYIYWTGLQTNDKVYVWQDGTNTTDIDLVEPYLDEWQSGKDCVAMDKSSYPKVLIHDDCFAVHRYVCQKAAV